MCAPENGYTYVRGDLQRYQTKRVRTILPAETEGNGAFELRMHGLALQLLSRPEIVSVSTDIDRMNGSNVKCTVTIVDAQGAMRSWPTRARPAGGSRGAGAVEIDHVT